MSDRLRLVLILVIIALVAFAVVIVTDLILYYAALENQRILLEETVESQARLMESVAMFDQQHEHSGFTTAREATLFQIMYAHQNYKIYSPTGEFTIGYLDENQIHFFLVHYGNTIDVLDPIPMDSEEGLAEPMRRALRGERGNIIAKDYDGTRVLAAYEPVAVLDLGLVAKIDIAEIRAPFIEAGVLAFTLAVVLASLGAVVTYQLSQPIIDRLQRYSINLEGEVISRTEELRNAQEKIVRQEKLATLGQLAGSVGHELRNPLGVIHNSVYFLNNSGLAEHPTQKKYLDIIADEVRISEKIVRDLLDFARLKPGNKAPVRVVDLIQGGISRSILTPRVVLDSSDVSPSLRVKVDEQQIIQVMTNLIQNAVDAMPEGGKISFSAEEEGGMVRLSVCDQGTGIKSKDLEKIFEPLFTTKYRGIGLGLAISHRLAEMNGGTLTVTSEEGAGSVFTLSLPQG